MNTQQKSRRDFLYATGAAGLLAAGATAIPLTTLASQLHKTSLWPARVPDPNARRGSSLPQLGIRVYSKLGFGPRPGDLTSFNSLGGSDNARLTAWLNEQLNQGPDPEVANRLNSSRYLTLNKTLTQLWADHHRYEGPDSWQVRNRPYWEMQLAALTRSVHSKWQLREMLADFWHNHFNVDGSEDVVRSVLPDYDRNVIRAGLFGNFRDMLENVVKHTAMMYYLDNRRNSSPNPNENYARELLELHTLGAVENYYGFVDPSEVPDNADGQPAGYVEQDVLEMARLLTGFGVADGDDDALDTGDYLFRPAWHDDGSKTIMGQVVAHDPLGEAELSQILDYLASHRGTAEYICWKLAVRLVGDSFSASSAFVQSAADVFQNNWQDADQLTQVYRHMLDSSTFRQTWGDKARRPMEIISSALRAADVDYDFQLNGTGTDAGFYGYYWTWRDAGQMPFNCEPPTGYAEDRAIWKGSGPLIMSWRAISRLLRDIDSVDGSDNAFVNLAQQTNDAGIARSPNAITDYWLNRVHGPGHGISTAKRNEMIAFLNDNSGGAGFDQPLDINTDDVGEWSTYQKLMRGLFLLVALVPERMIR